MSWPLSQDYNEAIQSPASNFADPDLRRGEAVANALGIPMPYSGNFADVYQVRCPDGGRWAVKCFTRQAVGLRERYQEISRCLRQAKLPFTVDFTYLEQGIRVAGKWHPVLKMQWVEGLTLNQFVGKYADNPIMLEGLLQIWGRMAKLLRSVEVSHCDLQHGNVLLVPGASANSLALKLIDYDGMWVPALASTKSGEVGHPCYQHPQRLRDGTYSMDVDRFPVLLIATALRALKVRGKPLWDAYDNGDNLLFKEADLVAPLQSHLFLDLTKTGDALVGRMMDILVKALRGSLETVPLLGEMMAEARSLPAVKAVPHPAASPTTRGLAQAAVATAPITAGVPAREPWNFGESARVNSIPSAARLGRNRAKAPGVPIWAWTGAITLLVAGLGGVAAVFLATRGDSGGASASPVLSQNRSTADSPAHGGAPALPPNNPGGTDKAPIRIPLGGGNSAPPLSDPIPPPPQTAPLESNITNSVGMKLVLIPAGKFTMGSPPNEVGRKTDEGPQHEVEITRAFYMGVYPVTRGQFAAVVMDAGYQTEEEKAGGKNTWRNPDFTAQYRQTDDHPVVEVSWNDAVKFCEWLSRKEGRIYELPTEAQWEYACRAGTTTPFSFGATISTDQANYNGNSVYDNGKRGVYREKTTPVGSFPPNALGLYDMHGNVWQWCADGFGPYEDKYIKDPKYTDSLSRRVLRGGCWGSNPGDCRSAFRLSDAPGYRYNVFGFRVVLRTTTPAP